MPSKTLFVIILLSSIFLLPSLAFPYDWQAKGITAINEIAIETGEEDAAEIIKPDLSENVVRLTDSEGHIFTLIYKKEITDADANKIIELKTKLYGLRDITVRSLTFRAPGNGIIDIILIPQRFSFIDANPQEFLPAGMLLQNTDVLEYKFHLVKDSIVVRIAGVLSDEERFKTLLTEAYNNPKDYMRKREPEYILKQLDEHEANIKKMQKEYDDQTYGLLILQNKGFFGGINVISRETVDRIVAMKKTTPLLTKEQIKTNLENNGIKISDKELKLIFSIYFNEFE